MGGEERDDEKMAVFYQWRMAVRRLPLVRARARIVNSGLATVSSSATSRLNLVGNLTWTLERHLPFSVQLQVRAPLVMETLLPSSTVEYITRGMSHHDTACRIHPAEACLITTQPALSTVHLHDFHFHHLLVLSCASQMLAVVVRPANKSTSTSTRLLSTHTQQTYS